MSSGIEKAWDLIQGRDPSDVCTFSGAVYDVDRGCYGMLSLGHEFRLCPMTRTVTGLNAEGQALCDKHRLFFEHAVIWHLAASRGVGRTGRLVKPASIKGGHHFFTRGTHKLPLDDIAQRHGSSAEEFIKTGQALGGVVVDYADAALELYPTPGVPVTIVLWSGDDEFSPRADLLFDSSAEYQLPLDVLWSAAMLSIAAIL